MHTKSITIQLNNSLKHSYDTIFVIFFLLFLFTIWVFFESKTLRLVQWINKWSKWIDIKLNVNVKGSGQKWNTFFFCWELKHSKMFDLIGSDAYSIQWHLTLIANVTPIAKNVKLHWHLSRKINRVLDLSKNVSSFFFGSKAVIYIVCVSVDELSTILIYDSQINGSYFCALFAS